MRRETDMSHPDEGTIQMLLDGELDAAERGRVERHVEACAACAERVAEARAFMEEADRLVGTLEVPRQEGAPRTARGRRAMVRTLAWAASIVVAVGVGYWSRGAPADLALPTARQEGDRPQTVAVTPPVAESVSPPAAVAAPEPAPSPAKPLASRDAGPGAGADERKVADPSAENVEPRDKAGSPPPAALDRSTANAPASAPAMRGARLGDEPGPAWRVVSMEEAVRVLDGQIRLIDGLAPERVELGSGTSVPGADPGAAVVRVVYASGGVILDQQRAPASFLPRQEAAAKAVGLAAEQPAPTGWQERGGLRFVVTGNVSADSLRALGDRVR